jgi:hypothetical protein
MSRKSKRRQDLSEQEIDQIVIAQADTNAAWEKPVRVRRAKQISIEQYSLITKHASHAEEFNAKGR